jgi:hypothetical protein
MRGAAFSWRDTTNDVRSILHHLLRMKRAFLTSDSLHHEARVFVYKNAHNYFGLWS